MRRVEQHVISRSHAKWDEIDQMAFASKNLWNLATYHTRQAFIFEKTYQNSAALYPVVLGSGKRLFPQGTEMSTFKLLETKAFTTGIVVLHYQPET